MDIGQSIPRWQPIELTFTSDARYDHPAQEVRLRVRFSAPGGRVIERPGFWDGGATWRVRFAPPETGSWEYETMCSNTGDGGLHGRRGTFECTAAQGGTRFERHGPVGLSENRRHLAHADGTPFFWLADTCWNGPLRSTDSEWDHYLEVRAGQQFSAVQWVATQWIAAPDGDLEGQLAYQGHDRIEINPAFFQRLDGRLRAINAAGLLAAPVMLWAASWGSPQVMAVNPGLTLPEDQAALLAEYMLARWGAYHVVWILAGDGDYSGENAGRWKRIGRQVFGGVEHAPVSLHPAGSHWNMAEFGQEMWLDITGYQSSHSSGRSVLSWLVGGPPACDWRNPPPRPFINLEPNYEGHVDFATRKPFQSHAVRRAAYWSLLNAPTAGVSYGAHGVWGWDDGTAPPVAHPASGVPLPWQQALHLPGARHMTVLAEVFSGIEWTSLLPMPELQYVRPGSLFPEYTVTSSAAPEKDLAVVYLPYNDQIEIRLDRLKSGARGRWVDPRSGKSSPASPTGSKNRAVFTPPGPEDWLLLLEA